VDLAVSIATQDEACVALWQRYFYAVQSASTEGGDESLCRLRKSRDGVTAKTATPTKVDSKLTEAQLESRKRAAKALEGTWSRRESH